jgi:hypothetical protein
MYFKQKHLNESRRGGGFRGASATKAICAYLLVGTHTQSQYAEMFMYKPKKPEEANGA